MTRITTSLFFAALLAFCLHVASAQAQYVRTCVSANGNDANTCHCNQPCRTFQRAHDQTLSDGEVTVLDPGGYGPVTITKSISIVNDWAGEASIQVSGGGTGITVNAPAAGYVNLRGITIQGVGFGGGVGLRFGAGFALTMTNCVVRNHTNDGIQFLPVANSHLSLSNTILADNGGNGIRVQPTGGGSVKVTLTRVEAYNNSGDGIFVDGEFMLQSGAIRATVTDSVAANNGATGFAVNSRAQLILIRSVAAANAKGASASNASILLIGQSTVTGNKVSWSTAGTSLFASYGDNNIDANDDGGPAPPTFPKK